ncbi:MAG: hypothetical protein M1335_07020 [Chloroflexi bacterium]|nr:hypothetical protein [Chloroflexota bacterium]
MAVDPTKLPAEKATNQPAEEDDKDLIAELLTAQNERITALESGFANFIKKAEDFFTLKPSPPAPPAAPKATETVVKPAAEAAKEVATKAKHGAGLFW